HLFHLGSIHAFPTIQPNLPMQGGGLVHLCARGTRSGLQCSQRQHRVLQPKRGSNGVFESFWSSNEPHSGVLSSLGGLVRCLIGSLSAL
ncbi:hypothetical protein L211DRAFT_843742, partial [Terfezia boudieri ATCC MYA-4762]